MPTDKTIFQEDFGSAPLATDITITGQDPSGIPSMKKVTWQSIANLFASLATFVTTMRTSLKLDTLDLVIPGGGLLIPSTGGCDSKENVTTYVNSQLYAVNKFAKTTTGQANLAFAPPAWDLGTVTAKIKCMDVGLNVVDNCDVAWAAAANVTCTADTSVKVEGTASNKMACAAGLAADALMATHAITSLDLKTIPAIYIDMMFRSDTALSAGDLVFMIDNSATCASPTKTWDMPAISANVWTPVTITCGDMSGAGNDAIISVGFKQHNDKGAMNCYSDCISWRTAKTMTIRGAAVSSGDTADVAWGTIQEIAFTPGYWTPTVATFPTLTIGGTPALADQLQFEIGCKTVATEAAGKTAFLGANINMTRSTT
jgi:hypothetical protein